MDTFICTHQLNRFSHARYHLLLFITKHRFIVNARKIQTPLQYKQASTFDIAESILIYAALFEMMKVSVHIFVGRVNSYFTNIILLLIFPIYKNYIFTYAPLSIMKVQ